MIKENLYFKFYGNVLNSLVDSLEL